MTTLTEIQARYQKPIKRDFKIEIERYINNPEVQIFINKALRYELTSTDKDTLYKIGSFKSKQYPKLNWLCLIYIHPLTILENCANKMYKTQKTI